MWKRKLAYWCQYIGFVKGLKIDLPYNLMHSKDSLPTCPRHTSTTVFTAALFMWAELWNQPQCPAVRKENTRRKTDFTGNEHLKSQARLRNALTVFSQTQFLYVTQIHAVMTWNIKLKCLVGEQKELKVKGGARKGDRRPEKGCSMYRIHLYGNQNSKELESLLSFMILNCVCVCMCVCTHAHITIGVPI